MAAEAERQPEGSKIQGVIVDVFSGLGLGLLLGVIVGLSVTPVVSVVVGAIAALLAVFLGLESGDDAGTSTLSKVRLNGVRIGSFGLATVLGLMLGLFVRGNHLFDEPIDKHLARWEGFPTEVAQQMVVFERTGIVPRTLAFSEDGPAVEVALDEQAALARSNVLVNALQDRDLCDELDPDRWNNLPDRVLRQYDAIDEPLFLDIAAQIRQLPDDATRLSMLNVVHQLICEMQEAASP